MFSLGALIFFAFKIFRKVVSVQKIHFFIVRRYKSLKPYVFFLMKKCCFCNLIEAKFICAKRCTLKNYKCFETDFGEDFTR